MVESVHGGGGGRGGRDGVGGGMEGEERDGDTECKYTLLKMRILAFLHTNPTIHLI